MALSQNINVLLFILNVVLAVLGFIIFIIFISSLSLTYGTLVWINTVILLHLFFILSFLLQ